MISLPIQKMSSGTDQKKSGLAGDLEDPGSDLFNTADHEGLPCCPPPDCFILSHPALLY
jgi:hypothetical protein